MRNEVLFVVIPQGRNRKPVTVQITVKKKRAEAITRLLLLKYKIKLV